MSVFMKKIREDIKYALESADTKPTFEWLKCTARRYTFMYLALLILFINQFYRIIDTLFASSWLGRLADMYQLFIASLVAFLLTCLLYINNLDHIQDKLTTSLRWLLQKIRWLNPNAPWEQLVYMNLHCDDELQEVVQAINTKSKEIQHYINYLEKLIWYIQHEFNTPLAIIKLHLERIQNIEWKSKKNIEWIEEEIEHMWSLVSAIVWLIQTKTESFDNETFQLSEVIHKIAHQLKTIYPETTFDTSITQDVSLTSNKQYVWAICRNICENAIKHWSDHVKISIDTNELTIQDNGSGMDTQTLENIWLPFWKKSPRSWKQEWFGLWLSLVKVLVEKLHRKSDVKSSTDSGTTFTFSY